MRREEFTVGRLIRSGSTNGAVTVLETDENGLVTVCKCATGSIPSAVAGYAVGCLLIDTTTGKVHQNSSATSCSFNAIGDIAAGEITLAEGNVLIGNASGVAAALSGKTDTRILVGNGTTMTSVAVSGDITLSNAGVVAIGAKKVTAGMAALASGKILAGQAGGEALAVTPSGAVTMDAAGAFSLTTAASPFANTIADPGTGVAIPVTASGVCAITTAAAETNTLAAPSAIGMLLAITCDVYAVGDRVVTCATTVNQTGNNTLTFGAAGDTILLYSTQIGGALRWRVASNDGVDLTTV